MGTPVQVKRQVEEAEALARELGMAPTEEPAPTEGEGETPPAEPVAEGTADVVDITPAEGEPAPTEPAAQEPTAEPATDWEQKFKTLQGKYDKEVGDLNSDVRGMREQLASTQNIIASMQQAPAAEGRPEPEPEAPSTVITDTEVNDFGEDLLDVVGRKAVLALQPAMNQIMERLNKLENGVSSVQQTTLKTERSKVYDALNEWGAKQTPAVDWSEVNKSQGFRAWLAEADPFAGQQRAALLRDAFDSNDGNRIVAFFAGYLNEQTTVTPAAPEPMAPATLAQQEPTAQVPLETLVTPGGAQEAAPASAHGDSAGQSFTNGQVAQFYADITAGRYKGREAEKDALERAIHDAANNGRITG